MAQVTIEDREIRTLAKGDVLHHPDPSVPNPVVVSAGPVDEAASDGLWRVECEPDGESEGDPGPAMTAPGGSVVSVVVPSRSSRP